MKLFRRIFALALAIVMVCLLGTSAFAATTFEDNMYCGNNEELVVDAEIARYYTSATIDHLTYDSAENYSSIAVTYSYYRDEYGTRVTLSDSETAYNEYYFSMTKTISQNYFAMISATYTFEARVSAQSGSQYYGPVTTTLKY